MRYACITEDVQQQAASCIVHESLNGGLTVDGYNSSSSSTLGPRSISDLKMEVQRSFCSATEHLYQYGSRTEKHDSNEWTVEIA